MLSPYVYAGLKGDERSEVLKDVLRSGGVLAKDARSGLLQAIQTDFAKLKDALHTYFNSSVVVDTGIPIETVDPVERMKDALFDEIKNVLPIKSIFVNRLNLTEWSKEAVWKWVLHKSKLQFLADIRKVVMYYFRTFYKMTYSHIGRIMERDHSTVMFAVRYIEDMSLYAGMDLVTDLREALGTALNKHVKTATLVQGVPSDVFLESRILATSRKLKHNLKTLFDYKIQLLESAIYVGLLNETGLLPEQIQFLGLYNTVDFTKLTEIQQIAVSMGVKVI